MVTIGSLYPSIRIEIKQLLYLQKVLKKEDGHWAKVTLLAMRNQNISWAKQVRELLEKWGLEQDWEKIKEKNRLGNGKTKCKRQRNHNMLRNLKKNV